MLIVKVLGVGVNGVVQAPTFFALSVCQNILSPLLVDRSNSMEEFSRTVALASPRKRPEVPLRSMLMI